MTLSSTRRRFLAAAAGTAGVLVGARLEPCAEAAPQHPQPLPSPNAPSNQNVPAGLNNYPSEDPARAAQSSFNAAQLNAMVQQLYQMSLALKQETDQTNLKNTLPADFLKRAQQIEKLAKAIRERARG